MRVTPELKNCDNCLVKGSLSRCTLRSDAGAVYHACIHEQRSKEGYPRGGKLTGYYANAKVSTLLRESRMHSSSEKRRNTHRTLDSIRTGELQ